MALTRKIQYCITTHLCEVLLNNVDLLYCNVQLQGVNADIVSG